MDETVELEKFESWVRSHFLMHHEWLKPGQGKWRYAKNETLFMWDAWKARAELTPNVEVTGLPQPDTGSDTNAARCGRSG